MLFSIITVTKNNLTGLKATSQSIAQQNFKDFEWIVIDGASQDETIKFLAKTQAVWKSEPDSGIYDAMNKGIDIAKGRYLLFLNAGDCLVASNILNKIAAQQNGQDFLYGDALEGGFHKKSRDHNAATFGMFTHHQAMVYRRNVLGILRYNTSYSIAADYDFTLRFLAKAKEILYIPTPFCTFEQGGISQRNAKKGRQEQFRIRREQHISGMIENAAIYIFQTALWHFRKTFPAIYWKFKKMR